MAMVQESIGHQESPLECVCGVVFPDSGSNVAQKVQSAGHFHTACKQNPFPYRESHSVLAVFKTLSSHYSRYFTILCSFLNLDFKIIKKSIYFFSMVRIFCKSLLLQCLTVSDSTLQGPLAYNHLLTLTFFKLWEPSY